MISITFLNNNKYKKIIKLFFNCLYVCVHAREEKKPTKN